MKIFENNAMQCCLSSSMLCCQTFGFFMVRKGMVKTKNTVPKMTVLPTATSGDSADQH